MRRSILCTLVLAFACAPLSAQSLSDRIRDYKQRQSTRRPTDDREKQQAQQQATLQRRLYDIMPSVDLDGVGAKTALTWWSQSNGIPIVINWAKMELAGIMPDTPVTVKLNNVPAVTALQIMLEQLAPFNTTMVYELTPWYVRVMTRDEALANTAIRVYDIGDMLMEIPDFDNAPSLSLSAVVGGGGGRSGGRGGSSSVSMGSGGGGGGGSIFGDTDNDSDDDDDDSLSKADRAEQLAQIIRDTIEPDIWQANGGQYSNIRYFSNRLVIRAPMFVHRQIGPSLGTGLNASKRARQSGGGGMVRSIAQPPPGAGSPSDVSSVQRSAPTSPSAVQQRR